jgi:hypothetical protein
VLAGINQLFPTLEDRCIVVRLSQPAEDKAPAFYSGEKIEVTQTLVELIHSALKYKLPELGKIIADPLVLEIDSRIKFREFDKWFPVLSIAKLFSTRKSNYFKQLQQYALEQVESKIKSESTTPENMCKAILMDFLAYKAGKTMVDDPDFFFFRTEEIQSVIQRNDLYNSYGDKAAMTRILKKIGVETDRRRFGSGPVALYKIPKSFLN